MLKIVDYLLKSGCPPHIALHIVANTPTLYQLEQLQYENIDWEFVLIIVAVENGHLKYLKYLHENGMN